MDAFEKLLDELREEWPLGQWDKEHRNYQIKKFIDRNDGIWDWGASAIKCPCGCPAVSGQNRQRIWYFCDKHHERGILISTFLENKFYWLPKP